MILVHVLNVFGGTTISGNSFSTTVKHRSYREKPWHSLTDFCTNLTEGSAKISQMPFRGGQGGGGWGGVSSFLQLNTTKKQTFEKEKKFLIFLYIFSNRSFDDDIFILV